MTTTTTRFLILTCALALLPLTAPSRHVQAQGAPATAPAYTATGELMLPADFREWVFVGTSLGMTYGPAKRTGPAV